MLQLCNASLDFQCYRFSIIRSFPFFLNRWNNSILRQLHYLSFAFILVPAAIQQEQQKILTEQNG